MYAALYTDTTLNPLKGNEYFEPEKATALILIKVSDYADHIVGKREIILTGWGTCDYEKVGNIVHLRADQSCRNMGRYKVIGIVSGGVISGNVPNSKRRHFVMK